MAGNIFAKERSIITLSTTLSSMTNGSATSAGTTLDCRSAGNSAEDFLARFELVCQWATITGIVAGTIVADLYLVPALDGTNYPDLDTTAGSSRLPLSCYAGSFEAQKAPTANTNMRFVSPVVDLEPVLYAAYVLNKSGQTISANASLKGISVQAQYS